MSLRLSRASSIPRLAYAYENANLRCRLLTNLGPSATSSEADGGMTKSASTSDMQAAFEPPAVCTISADAAVKTIDKSQFAKTVPLARARVHDHRTIGDYRKKLLAANELLKLQKTSPIQYNDKGEKFLLLHPRLDPNSRHTWGVVLSEGVAKGDLTVEPWQMALDYDFWGYLDVMKAVLPSELQDEIPVGFNAAGHVAHLNLREQYLPYKSLIAQVLIDKNPVVKTVINKIEDVGAGSQFRTFPFEVLAGDGDLNVTVVENDCTFSFDYGRVYWNSKLNMEHRRLRDVFRPGEVVCDAMAGVGPFAVPAGKKGVFVFANDLNPASYEAMVKCIAINKVSQHVRPSNEDGGAFIARSGELVLEASRRGDCAVIKPKGSRLRDPSLPAPQPTKIPVPPTISHYVMNLPGSATAFLHNFRGVYRNLESLFAPHTDAQLPLVHVYTFYSETTETEPPEDVIRKRIHDQIGTMLDIGDGAVEGQLALEDVRDVAPNKRMFCATFRLPAEVAFGAKG